MTADDDDETSFARRFKREALHFAAGEGELCRVEELLAEGYPINAFDDMSWTPLHWAARRSASRSCTISSRPAPM
jgi:ankyrin repeat protein